MTHTRLLVAALFLTAPLAFLPSADALETPPPCQTMTTCCGIEPAFAPCCSPVSCPPPVARCPTLRVHTSDFLAYMGPHASIDVYSDCSASVCLDQTGTCCVLDGALSRCSAIAASAELAEIDPPVHVEPVVCVTDPCPPIVWCDEQAIDGAYLFGVYVDRDCSITVGIIDGHRACGFNGLQHHQVRATQGPLTLVVNYCTPYLECTCDPIVKID